MSHDVCGRVLGVVLRGQEAAAIRALGALVGIARADRAWMRLAYVHPLPRPRVNREDRVVVDQDLEMARITDRIGGLLSWAARRFDDIAIDTVVRFGVPRREVAIETEAFQPQLVACFASSRGSLLDRFRAWTLRRSIVRVAPARVVVFETPTLDDRYLRGYRPSSASALNAPGPLAARKMKINA